MEVTIETSDLKHFQNKDLIEAAHFFGKILMHGNLRKHIKVVLNVSKDFEDCGVTRPTDDIFREFTINLGHSPEDPIALYLAHEMVHVKQYAKGELRSELVFRGTSMKLETIWKGKLWKPSGKEDPYYDRPQEIEAYGREMGLFNRWMNRNDN